MTSIIARNTDTETVKLVFAEYPSAKQTQLWALLGALERGERLTVLIALERYQTYALSQRMGQLKALGWPILSRMVKVPSGKSIMEYWL